MGSFQQLKTSARDRDHEALLIRAVSLLTHVLFPALYEYKYEYDLRYSYIIEQRSESSSRGTGVLQFQRRLGDTEHTLHVLTERIWVADGTK